MADGVDPVSGLCRPPRYDDEEGVGIFWTVERSGARIPESSDNFASDGVGDCWARQANVKAWKSNL